MVLKMFKIRRLANLCRYFEYIIELNKASGRSFNDLSQYPIFPWIIKDYNCQFIKLKVFVLVNDENVLNSPDVSKLSVSENRILTKKSINRELVAKLIIESSFSISSGKERTS